MLVGDIRNIIAIGKNHTADQFHALTTTYWLVTHWADHHFAGALEYFDKHGEKNRRPQVYRVFARRVAHLCIPSIGLAGFKHSH